MIMPANQLVGAPSVDISVEWEETACLLCGSPESSPLVEAPDAAPGGSGLWFAVVQCQKCGLCFTNPRPSLSSSAGFYPQVYRPHRMPESERRGLSWARPFKDEFRWGKQAKSMLPRRGRNRLLDLGCGGGNFLERMHRLGWQVTGLDVSEDAVKRIRYGLALEARVGTLPCPDLPTAGFDLITMWQTLEHLHEPLEALRDAHRLLAPGGELVLSVPNIDSLPFRLFGHAWSGLDLPRHLTHFTPPTLHAMLERAGFISEPVRMIRHSGWLRASAKLSSRLQQHPVPKQWLRSKAFSRLLTWYSYCTSQADCISVRAFK
ncbi:MAG TPA: class I SAM-dependent methyltransferase [Gemmataceae bacterium]|nr:class I SAM-dependent methyltransferase [Gemmataceae bacterium]